MRKVTGGAAGLLRADVVVVVWATITCERRTYVARSAIHGIVSFSSERRGAGYQRSMLVHNLREAPWSTITVACFTTQSAVFSLLVSDRRSLSCGPFLYSAL